MCGPQRVVLKKRAEHRVRAGHLWIFSNEIDGCGHDSTLPPGSMVEVYSHSGAYLGLGYYNPHTLIAVRLLSRRREPD